jgi:hypothetical protein
LLRLFVTLVCCILRDEVGEEAQSFVCLGKGDFDLVAKDILDWFLLPTNFQWLLVFDNVDYTFVGLDAGIEDFFSVAD